MPLFALEVDVKCCLHDVVDGKGPVLSAGSRNYLPLNYNHSLHLHLSPGKEGFDQGARPTYKARNASFGQMGTLAQLATWKSGNIMTSIHFCQANSLP